jgi:hypothetical protein
VANPFTIHHIISRFKVHWDTATDIRKPNNNMRYAIADAVMCAYSVFFMQSNSFLAHQRILQQKNGGWFIFSEQ